tara:strand:+ start:1346 stop:2485 length:1140 start_codon:yes stop_codon:yes gene_type:complete
MNKYTYQHTTLDKKHNEMIDKFNNNETNIIPNLKLKIEKLEKCLNNKKNINKIDKADLIKKNITDLKNTIYRLEKEKTDYFLNNSKHIFDYFENKKQINLNNKDTNINNLSLNNDKINKFFNNVSNDTGLENEIIPDNLNNNYIQKYFYNLDNLNINYENFCYKSDICTFCNKGEMIYVESDGISICNKCSKTEKYLIENDKPSYKEPPKEVCFYAYKRINHLREILAQFQAKESTYIPDEVFNNIKNQIKKERIELKDLTNKKTKDILKNLGYNKYYEHIPFIKDKLGIKPPIMSQELEEKLCNLFMEIQKPYALYCPKDRVNFLNYYYTLYKLCELLNERKFLAYFPMLKDREKRMEQDEIWKKICEELNWEFIPTV